MPKNTIITLQEVQNAFFERGIRGFDKGKIAERYYLIDDHDYLCVRDPDRIWLPCTDEDDEHMACNELIDILELDQSIVNEYYMVVASAIHETCFYFGEMTQKEKVPFYIAVLDRLL